MDANGNGVLEPTEIPEDRRRMLGFLADRAGVDPNGPINIGQVRDAMSRRGSSSQGDPRNRQESGARRPSQQAEPLVPGFGVEEQLARVPEFGERVQYSLSPGSGGSGSSSSDASRRREAEDRARRFVPFIMSRYDTNKSGALEKEEWGQMRTDPSPADRNHDGVVTADELTAAYVERSTGGSSSGNPSSSLAGGSGGSGSTGGNGRRSYRFLTSAEQLPGGLPGWFTENDANQDGQIAMAEYSRSWSASKASEFLRYDLNGDGIITPHECLAAGAPGPEQPSPASQAPSPSSPSSGQSGSSGNWWE